MKRNLQSFLYIISICFSLLSCGDDDIEEKGNSDFKINNTTVDKVLSAKCEKQHLQDEYWLSFGSNFYFDGSVTSLEIGVPFKSFSQLKEGQDLISHVDFIGFGYSNKSYEAEGNLKVTKITDSKVTLQFSNLSFLISYGPQRGQEYIINGKITYDFN